MVREFSLFLQLNVENSEYRKYIVHVKDEHEWQKQNNKANMRKCQLSSKYRNTALGFPVTYLD